MNYYSDIELVRFDKFKANKIKLSRNQELFKKPFMLAKMFIENAIIDLTNTKIENIILLWDMNKLFEEFVFELLKRNESDWKFTAQKGKYLFKNNNDKPRMTNVDIIAKKGEEKVIIDTKYKKFETLDDVANSDIYQVTAYCLLHGAGKGILLYPKWDKTEHQKEGYYLNSDVIKDLKINFKTVNLKKDLREELKKKDNKIIGDLKKLFETEVNKE